MISGRKTEILAPAGNMECLVAALRAGTDAVYLGHKDFSARRNAANFDHEELCEGVSMCREQGVKTYLTLNTAIKNRELKPCYDVLESACKAGVNGIIVQDFAVIKIIKEYFPYFEIHGSTQMSLSVPEDFLALQNMGFIRAVVPREASLEQIIAIKSKTNIELEAFVHGALCMSFSGQCYLSSIIGGRSGNRGLCAQPCRLNFNYNHSENIHNNILSLKDLCLIRELKALQNAGVTSFKIEGRMKRPEYVAAAVSTYKKALAQEEYDEQALKAVFSRQGFTNGYFIGKIDNTMFGTRQREDTIDTPNALKHFRQIYHKQTSVIGIKGEFSVDLMDVKNGTFKCHFVVKKEKIAVSVSAYCAQMATGIPLDKTAVLQQLSKTGGTPFYFEDILISLPENIFIANGFLKDLRRRGIDELSQKLKAIEPRKTKAFCEQSLQCTHQVQRKTQNFNKKISAEFLDVVQLSQKIIDYFDLIYLPSEEIIKNCNMDIINGNIQKFVGILPFPFCKNSDETASQLKKIGINKLGINSLGEISIGKKYGFEIHGRYTFNITNTISATLLSQLGLISVTPSFENDTKAMETIAIELEKQGVETDIIIYGFLPLMRLRNCPVKSFASCDECAKKGYSTISDRTKRNFFVKCQHSGISILYNSNVLHTFDIKEKLPQNVNQHFFFTKETRQQIESVIKSYELSLPCNEKFTRGMFLKGVL